MKTFTRYAVVNKSGHLYDGHWSRPSAARRHREWWCQEPWSTLKAKYGDRVVKVEIRVL